MKNIEHGTTSSLSLNGNNPDISPSEKKSIELGIYNETDRLTHATIWGPLGTEAFLAQFYPLDQSLFLDDMNVVDARKEAEGFSDYLQGKGVTIVHARDVLAGMLPPIKMSSNDIYRQLVSRSEALSQQFTDTQFIGNIHANKIDTRSIIKELLEADIARYGEDQAIALNHALCLSVDMPMGNAIYARDQMNVLLDKRVSSAMKKPIRKPEVAMYEMMYSKILKDKSPIILPEGETFEGGDAYIFDNTVYVGVGVRTSLGAATHIFDTLEPQLTERDMRFAVVTDIRPEDQMESIHLDTYSSPVGKKEILVCEEEASFRTVSILKKDKSGNIITENTGLNYVDFLNSENNQVGNVPTVEQRAFGCNFLALDDNTVVLPIEDNSTTFNLLQSLGKTVDVVDLFQSTRGYGAAHCMTGQLRRDNNE
jgi:arginine deiminase